MTSGELPASAGMHSQLAGAVSSRHPRPRRERCWTMSVFVLLLSLTAVACGRPPTTAAESCEDVAEQAGLLLVDAVERDIEITFEERGWDPEEPIEASGGEDLPPDFEPESLTGPEDASPTRPPLPEDADLWELIVRIAPEEDVEEFTAEVAELRVAADDLECGGEQWADQDVAAMLREELQDRGEAAVARGYVTVFDYFMSYGLAGPHFRLTGEHINLPEQ